MPSLSDVRVPALRRLGARGYFILLEKIRAACGDGSIDAGTVAAPSAGGSERKRTRAIG
jgi:hypothetical protein